MLWLWCRQAATVLIRPLAWGLPYAACVALEKTKTNKQTNKKTKKQVRAMNELQMAAVPLQSPDTGGEPPLWPALTKNTQEREFGEMESGLDTDTLQSHHI